MEKIIKSNLLVKLLANFLITWLFIFQPLYYFWNLSWFYCRANSSCGLFIELEYLFSFFLGYFSETINLHRPQFAQLSWISDYGRKDIYLEILQTIGLGIILLILLNRFILKENKNIPNQ